MSTNFSSHSSGHQNWTFCGHIFDSYPVKIGSLVWLAIILLFSLVGNVLIITVVYTRQDLRKTINFFIVNMAISDFVSPLLSIPFSLAGIAASSFEWPISGEAGVILYKLNVYFIAVSLTVSVQSLVWIAFDRFVAVVFPMKAHLISSRFRAFAIASTWVVAVIINITDLYTTTVVNIGGALYCHSNNSLALKMAIGYARIALLCFAPMLIMTVLYCAIAVTLRRQDKNLRCTAVHESHQRKRQAIKMSIYIIITFYLFIFLYIIIPLILLSGNIALSCSASDVLVVFAFLGFYLSPTANVIICFTFVGSYRRGARELFSSCWSYKKKARSTINRGEAEEINLQRIKRELTSIEGVNLTFYSANSCN